MLPLGVLHVPVHGQPRLVPRERVGREEEEPWKRGWGTVPRFLLKHRQKALFRQLAVPKNRARAPSLNDAESNQHLHALSCLKIVLPINN